MITSVLISMSNCTCVFLDPIAFQAYYNGLRQFILDDVNCTGAETNLSQCLHNGLGSHNCHFNFYDNAAVRCGKMLLLCITLY